MNVHGDALSKASVYKSVKNAWQRQQQAVSQEMSPHRLRHGAAYSVLKSELGGEIQNNLLILKAMLGHENIRTTELYSSIPIIALQNLTGEQGIHIRHEEAEEIYRKTFLPEYKNTQKRGHRR